MAQFAQYNEAALELVTVTWGHIVKEVDLQGRTVKEAYVSLRDALGIPSRVTPVVNGRLAAPDQHLRRGDQLEFVKRSGELG
jgi:hypothetical protein